MIDIDGVNYSYDYSDLIEELEQDLSEGLIDSSTVIGVVRNSEYVIDGVNYQPIIDYYYPHAFEDDAPKDLYSKDEFSEEEWDKINTEYLENLKQFRKDKPHLQGMTVLAVLTEMKQWNSII